MDRLTALVFWASVCLFVPFRQAEGAQLRVPADYPSVTAAIAAAATGDTIIIAPGVYREQIVIPRPLVIRGPNAGIHPSSPARLPEAVITPAGNDPLGGTVVTIDASDVTLDGLTIDGDNAAIAGGVSLGGADVNAAWGVSNDTTRSPAVQRVSVKYSIIRNCTRAGIRFRSTGASTPASSGSAITRNRIENISSVPFGGTGISISYNFYAGVAGNVLAGVCRGIVLSHFDAPGSPSAVEENEIEARETGVWHSGLRTGDPAHPLPAFVARANRVGVGGESTTATGFVVTSVMDAVPMRLEDNTVSETRVGVLVWNCPTRDTVRMVRDSLQYCTEGIVIANAHPLFGAGDTSVAIVDRSFILGASGSSRSTAVLVKDSSAGRAPVGVVLRNGTLIDQGDDGIVLEGARVRLNVADAEVAGQTDAYIRLRRNNDSSKPSGTIDATRLRIEGSTGAGLSDAELRIAEEKIVHGTDEYGFGLVRIKPGWVFVTAGAGSLQRGVALASPGDRVRAFRGTYRETVVIPTDKAGVVLIGDNADRPVGGRVAESVIEGAVALLGNRTGLNGFTVAGGVALVGDTVGVWLNAGTVGQQVRYSILAGPGLGIRRGVLAGAGVDSTLIVGNQLTGWTSGLYFNPTAAPHGLWVTGNRFAGNTVAIGSDGINNILIRRNIFQNNALEGWGYSDVAHLGGRSLVADSNTFSGNGTGVRNYTSGPLRDTLVARFNAWGSDFGPADTTGSVEMPEDPTPALDQMRNAAPAGLLGDRVSEGVTYYPWIGKSRPVVESVVESGWNLMALSRLPVSSVPAELFPRSTAAVFGFNLQTQNTDPAGVLEVERGYWVKFDSLFTSEIAGERVDSIVIGAGVPGWLLVGSLTDPMTAAALVTDPPNALVGPVFRFNRSTQLYEPATVLTPGEGYWVKVGQPCTIRLR